VATTGGALTSAPAAARGAHGAYLATARFPSLDGLRFLSIVPVVWHHSTTGPLAGILGKGPVGVDLFFAISGFLITTLMLRERRASGRIAVGPFYARRALRIFPLYYAVLALYVVRALSLASGDPVRDHFFRSLPYWATYTANWFVDFGVPHPVLFAFGWSLATEEQFYAVWPWIVRASRGRAFPAIAALVLTALAQAASHGALAFVLPAGGLGERIVASAATPILLGAALALGLDAPRGFAIGARVLGARVSAPLALAAVVAMLAADGVPLVALQVGLVALVGASVVRPDHGLAPLLDAAPVRWVGTVSYGVYLFHVSAISAARRILPAGSDALPVFAVAFPLTLAAAAASYRWFERPFRGLRERFAR
jgi:peptidoglycan/LPS O-acetylase OafA/YrhL